MPVAARRRQLFAGLLMTDEDHGEQPNFMGFVHVVWFDPDC